MNPYPRDLHGYGRTPPDPRWPGGARLAVQFVINYEEGGERSVLHGDRTSESFLTEEPKPARPNIRDMAVESMFEYGSRAGFWRLYRLFTERNIPVTIFGVTTALERNPEAVAAMKEADWEIASHGLRWIDYSEMPMEERQHILEAVTRHRAGHRRTSGRLLPGPYERQHPPTAGGGGSTYDADSFADDLPSRVPVNGHGIGSAVHTGQQRRAVREHVRVPVRELRRLPRPGVLTAATRGRGAPEDDEHRPAHPHRGPARPGGGCLPLLLDRVAEAGPEVWVTRRIDIARHWHAEHPPEAA